ncbi:MAG: LysR substrate-binding domain-containing protein [Pseudomonadota bacterium]
MTLNITLKQLRYFEAVAAEGHFGRAAEMCAISQPALSVQVRELEEALGAPLFERAPRRVSLTAFGQDFRARAQDILRRVDDLGALAAQAGTGGALRLGVIPTIAPYLLPRLIPALRAEGHEVSVRETLTPHLLADLQAGRIDAAVLALPVEGAGVEALPLFDEALLVVRPEGQEGPLDLSRERLLLLEEGHCFRDQALAVCGTGKASELDGSSLSTLVQMVGAGLGITLIPQMAAQVEGRAAPVRLSRLPGPQPTRTVGLIWRKTSPLAARYRSVGEIVRTVAQGDVDAGRAAG